MRWHGSHARIALGTILALATLPAGAVELRQITFATPAYDNGVASPAWAPDSGRLAVVSWMVDRFYPYEIHHSIAVVQADGSAWWEFPDQHIPGTWHGPLNSEPCWSPSGDRIVFTAGWLGLWVGGVAEPLLTSLEIDGREPAWSPDGSTIAYSDLTGIWVVPAAGGTATRLTRGPDREPAWSPDGASIAFAASRGGRWDLWIVAAHGGEPRRITDDAAADRHPSWSPSGELIAFSSDRSGNDDVWIVRPANGALSQLTNDPAADMEPSWSPDGTRIAFASGRSGCQNIWIASDLRTIGVGRTTWSDLKRRFR